MFPDEGVLFPGMTWSLYRQEPHFSSQIDACAQILSDVLELDIRTLLYADRPSEDAQHLLRQAKYRHPILFAVSYALSKLLRSWGIRPSVLLGIGLGEYVAACEAGIFSLADGLKIVAARGNATDQLPQKATNGAHGIIGAHHSAMSSDVLEKFRSEFDGLAMYPPREVVADASGAILTREQATDVEYWIGRGLISGTTGPDATSLGRLQCGFLLEVGQKTSLTSRVEQAGFRAVSVIRDHGQRGDDCESLLEALGEMWVEGVKIDWAAFYRGQNRNRVSLPVYPFRRNRYCLQPRAEYSGANHIEQNAVDMKRGAVHPLLGRRWSSSGQTKIYESLISANSPTFLKDHRLVDTAIFPGAAYAEMALAAARLEFGNRPIRIEEIKFERALMLSDEQPCHIQTIVHRNANDTFSFEIARHIVSQGGDAEDSWQTHSTGCFAALDPASAAIERIDLARLKGRIAKPDALEFINDEFIKYGPGFRGLQELWTEGQEILARVELPPELSALTKSYKFHPVLLDSSLQAIGAITSRIPGAKAALPVRLLNWDIYSDVPQSFWVHIKLGGALGQVGSDQEVRDIAMCMFDDDGAPIARIAAYERRELASDLLQGSVSAPELLYELVWTEHSLCASGAAVSAATGILILTDDEQASAEMASHLSSRRKCTIATHHYLGNGGIESAIKRIANEAALRTGNLEVLFMRVGERDIDLARLCEMLLRSVQQILRDIQGTTASISIITRGCQSVCGSAVNQVTQVSGASLWGFAAALGKEHPDLRCISVDLDPAMNFDAAAVARELGRADGEDLVAYRGITRYVARLRKLAVSDPSAEPYPFKIAIGESSSEGTLTWTRSKWSFARRD
jgi:acyl transferase domain-containing protein